MNYLNYLHKQEPAEGNAAACLLTIIQYYGGSRSMGDLLASIRTTTDGCTRLIDIKNAALGCGFDANGFEANLDSLRAHNRPAILHVVSPQSLQFYYVVFFEYDDGCFVVGETHFGSILKLTQEQLDEIWLTKYCLMLEPTEKFEFA